MDEITQAEKVKLVYETAQSSADHYNNMTWILIPVMISFSVVVLKYNYGIDDFFYRSIILLMGIFSLFYLSFLLSEANNQKLLRYEICKKLENEEKLFGQHRLATKLKDTKQTGMLIIKCAIIILELIYLYFAFDIISDYIGISFDGVYRFFTCIGVALVLIFTIFSLYKLFHFFLNKEQKIKKIVEEEYNRFNI